MYSLPVKEIIRGRVIDDGGLATESLARRERRVKTAHLNLRLGGRNRGQRGQLSLTPEHGQRGRWDTKVPTKEYEGEEEDKLVPRKGWNEKTTGKPESMTIIG